MVSSLRYSTTSASTRDTIADSIRGAMSCAESELKGPPPPVSRVCVSVQ